MITDGIKNFLLKCPYLENDDIGVDFLGSEAFDYTIEIMPGETLIKKYTDGSTYNQISFVFASRNFYGRDNLQNTLFYEKFAAWLNECTKNGILPDIGENLTPEAIEAQSFGYLYSSGATIARYQIQCRLTYFKKC
ncbi:MAG: hypothetical protein E7404_05735 [Ruminococcaceae bacterium]|nr:hypothetical protein [Oscillospiraceae bacterium]